MAGNVLAVVDGRFCFPQNTDLVMQEQLGTFRNDNFTIHDSQGRPFFMLAAAPSLSLAAPRKLFDAYNKPVLLMEKKIPSLRGTWLIKRATDGVRVASVRPAMGLSPTIKVFLNDGDDEADFVIQGNLRAKKFTITHVVRGKGQRVVASIKKESKFSSVTAFVMSKLSPDTSKYHVTIEPGVDAAFMVALAVLVDEVYHDQPPQPQY